MTNKIVVAYIPVLHEGYRRFLEREVREGAVLLFVLDKDVLSLFDHMRKDIRVLPAEFTQKAIESWGLFERVIVGNFESLGVINKTFSSVAMPDEEECHIIAEKFLPECEVEFRNVFLRWDKKKILAENKVVPDRIISEDGAEADFMALAIKEGEKASDWWRQVGAVAVRNGEVLAVVHNEHLPTQREPYFSGDARSFFKKGLHFELTTGEHAESVLVGSAARGNFSLKDADVYVTDFPCPPCAKILARARIRRLYFKKGYDVLDGRANLKDAGVEIVLVK